MAKITAPVLLDSTGQSMLTALNTIATNVLGAGFVFLDALPATGGIEGVFYFISNGSSGDNRYDEYVWDKNNERFELIAANIIIDSTPTQGSPNPVSSGGVYSALDNLDTGHTIKDESGTSYTQRSNLVFVNAIITDDSTNDATVVEIEGGGTTIVQKPTVTVGTYTYNGSAQGPTITGLDTANTIVTNATKINAGTYTLTIALKNTAKMVWQDMTTANLTWTYSIAKATGSVNVSPTSITLDKDNLSDSASITVVGDGALTVTNNDTSGIYNYSYNSDTKVISVSENDEASGSGTVSIMLAEGNNYLGASTNLSITASFKPELVAWGSGTDDQIAAMINAYYDGVLTLNEIKSVWSIGDVRNISLSAMAATGVGESHRAQTVQMQILDFDHDTLTTAIGGKTKTLISVQQKDCLRDASVSDTGGSGNTEHGYMNSSNTNTGGWNSCARRTWCNNVYYNALPSTFKGLVKQVVKENNAGGGSATAGTSTNDYIWLPSEYEVFGTNSQSGRAEGTRYAWFANADANRYKLPKWNSSQVSDVWWERSSYGSDTTYFCTVGIGGNASGNSASNAYGLAPACSL